MLDLLTIDIYITIFLEGPLSIFEEALNIYVTISDIELIVNGRIATLGDKNHDYPIKN